TRTHTVLACQPAASSRASSAGSRLRSPAAAESRAVCGRDDPGIGTTTGEGASIQASTTRCGLTPCAPWSTRSSTTRLEVPALGGDQDVRGVAAPAAERLGDQRLVVPDLAGVQVVGVGGVDQGDAAVQAGVDRGDRLCPVRTS